MATKSVLGKGLASLLPGAANPMLGTVAGESLSPARAQAAPASAEAGSSRDRHPGISFASIDEIVANPHQPRRDFVAESLHELAQSIRENGIIQPLVVRKTSQGYELIAGERRLRASKIAGLKHVPIVIRKTTDRESLELALIENIQRENLNCIDEALAYFQLLNDFQLTQEEVSKQVGKSRATVANHLRLLNLPEGIIADLKKGALTFGHGKALLALEDSESRLRARSEIVQRNLSVRESEALVESMKNPAMKGAANASDQPAAKSSSQTSAQSRLATLSQELTRQYSARVEIRGSEKRGKIVLHYQTRDELDRLLGALQNGA